MINKGKYPHGASFTAYVGTQNISARLNRVKQKDGIQSYVPAFIYITAPGGHAQRTSFSGNTE
jgi:hypothetical protein